MNIIGFSSLKTLFGLGFNLGNRLFYITLIISRTAANIITQREHLVRSKSLGRKRAKIIGKSSIADDLKVLTDEKARQIHLNISVNVFFIFYRVWPTSTILRGNV